MNRPLLWSRARRLVITAVALVVALKVLPGANLQGEEKAAAPKSAAQERFQVPEGDADKISEFIETLAKTPPEGDTEQEQLAFSLDAVRALVKATDKLLAVKHSDQQERDAYEYKLEGLRVLVDLGQEDVRPALEETMTRARQHKQELIARAGWQAFIENRTGEWSKLSGDDKQAFRDEIIKAIQTDGVTPLDASVVAVTVMKLDDDLNQSRGMKRPHDDGKFLIKLLQDAIPLLKGDNKEVQEVLADANLEGILRRLTVLGKPLEIEGDLLSGGKYDIKNSRGKVVLVDYWFTTCPVCIAEMPNMRRLYDAYHEKGFEIIGINTDENPDEARQFTHQRQLPWDSIYAEEEKQRGPMHPMALRYGITQYPTAILVDQQGNVVSFNARGEELRRLLEKLLGEPARPIAEKAALGPVRSSSGG